MKFIHTADLHLDSPFNNLRGGNVPNGLWDLIYQSTYCSFRRIVDAAIRQQVDFVLIVGDLFDRQTRSVKAQDFLKRSLKRLNQHRIPVLLSFGNHDYYRGNYRDLRYPKLTYVFPDRVTTKVLRLKDHTTVGVTGFSYHDRWEPQRVIKHFPVKGDVDYQIGMIHGQVGSNNHYTPFTVDELKSKRYDYWALGHVHERKMLCSRPPIWYCGNIQGRNPNEAGEKGYLLVDSRHHLRTRFHATSVIDWWTLHLPLNSVTDEAQLIDAVVKFLARQRFTKLHLVALVLQPRGEFPADLLTLVKSGSVLDQLQARLQPEYSQLEAWVYQLQVRLPRSVTAPVDLERSYWHDSAQAVFNLANEDRLARKLFRQPFLNRRFNNTAAVKKLNRQARQLLQNRWRFRNED